MIKTKTKNKKAMELSIWSILLGAIVAIVIAGLVLYIVNGGLFTQQKNVAILSSCKNVNGYCDSSCPSTYTDFSGYGCPDGDDKSKKTCCIPKEKAVPG